MSKHVTLFGGSGFVGRYIVTRLVQHGWQVKIAGRTPRNADALKTLGVPGQVEALACNILNDADVQAALMDAQAVVNCVGVLEEVGTNTFAATQADGASRIARLAKEAGVSTFVQLSAIGASAQSASLYAQTKAAGEAAVLQHMPNAMILRPSIVFGAEDQFFNRFAAMAKLAPALPVVGGNTRFQPVYVDDVAAAAVLGVKGEAQGIFELGGPEVKSFRDLMRQMLDVIQRRRAIIDIPFPVARLMGFGFGVLKTLSGGVISGPVTTDQVKNLAVDNVVSADAKGFADLGISPTSMDAILPDYLKTYRP